MLKLSKKTDYAIILLTHLGEQESPVSAQEVATFYKLPYPMVANILKQLVSSGLIESTRGQRGGYVLAKSAEEINLSEIIRITDSTFELVECVHDEDLCKVHQCCPTRRPLIALHQKIKQFVEETTLAAIIEDSQTNNFNLEDTSYETAHLS
ncbi:MAG: Rrf2 family transcriptional regulator [SAR324 cluster bacterium]|nr:Rrf2 family transcriptional regulator [SAR324 cluster bacterium]MEE3265348.1 Rrf2 family transcriptional regulator [SAR324 cluster bacterium]